MDACVTSSAIVGMWWMAKRNIEHWIAWICSNLIAIPLNVYKGFMLYAIMYILLLVLAVRGWNEWKNKIESNETD
jgi:nicotinamide mononucleotide transporter